jgi:hypothetical protein
MRSQIPQFAKAGIGAVLGRATRTLSRCIVCGFREVRTDEVVDRGLLLLAECPRCEHRFTQRIRDAETLAPVYPLPARVRPAQREPAEAA